MGCDTAHLQFHLKRDTARHGRSLGLQGNCLGSLTETGLLETLLTGLFLYSEINLKFSISRF